MVFKVLDNEGSVIFDNTIGECQLCFSNIDRDGCSCKNICSNDDLARRFGRKDHQGYTLYLCSKISDTKTRALFDQKIDFLAYSLKSLLYFRDEVKEQVASVEREKYAKVVHNLRTLNTQCLMTVFNFISEEKLSKNYKNIFSAVQGEIVKSPREATITLIKLAKNNEQMKSEFSTHEKLSMDNPILSVRRYRIKNVILNVYHSFAYDFKEKGVSFKITETDTFVNIDYDTIRLAIYHLMSNALKYISDGSKFEVIIDEVGDSINVSFKMRSLYIFKTEVVKIMQDGYSGKVAVSKQLNGSGLGMGLIAKALSLNAASLNIIPGEKKIKINNSDFGDNIFEFTFPKPAL